MLPWPPPACHPLQGRVGVSRHSGGHLRHRLNLGRRPPAAPPPGPRASHARGPATIHLPPAATEFSRADAPPDDDGQAAGHRPQGPAEAAAEASMDHARSGPRRRRRPPSSSPRRRRRRPAGHRPPRKARAPPHEKKKKTRREARGARPRRAAARARPHLQPATSERAPRSAASSSSPPPGRRAGHDGDREAEAAAVTAGGGGDGRRRPRPPRPARTRRRPPRRDARALVRARSPSFQAQRPPSRRRSCRRRWRARGCWSSPAEHAAREAAPSADIPAGPPSPWKMLRPPVTQAQVQVTAVAEAHVPRDRGESGAQPEPLAAGAYRVAEEGVPVGAAQRVRRRRANLELSRLEHRGGTAPPAPPAPPARSARPSPAAGCAPAHWR